MATKRIIPSARPYFSEKDREWICAATDVILLTGRLILGPYTEQLEREFAEFIGVNHAIAVSSASAALDIIWDYYNIDSCEVIVPVNTFIADPISVQRAGGDVAFVDMDPQSYCMNIEDVEDTITDYSAAILAVHIGGLPDPNISVLRELCNDGELYLIEDCSHAHGAVHSDGRKVGSIGDAGVFSFYPTKNMTTGLGGMITTNDERLATHAKMARHHGMTKSLDSVVVLGSNHLMNEIEAAIGLVQLWNLPMNNTSRNTIALKYIDGLDKIGGFNYPIPEDGVYHVYYKFLADSDRIKDKSILIKTMKEEYGIQVGSLYMRPVNEEPVFNTSQLDNCQVAAKKLKTQISLPMYSNMSPDDVDCVLESLEEAMKEQDEL